MRRLRNSCLRMRHRPSLSVVRLIADIETPPYRTRFRMRTQYRVAFGQARENETAPPCDEPRDRMGACGLGRPYAKTPVAAMRRDLVNERATYEERVRSRE